MYPPASRCHIERSNCEPDCRKDEAAAVGSPCLILPGGRGDHSCHISHTWSLTAVAMLIAGFWPARAAKLRKGIHRQGIGEGHLHGEAASGAAHALHASMLVALAGEHWACSRAVQTASLDTTQELKSWLAPASNEVVRVLWSTTIPSRLWSWCAEHG